MAWIEAIKPTKAVIQRRTLIYGQHGWGKSTWAAGWKDPVFIRTEDGCSDLNVRAFPVCETYAHITAILGELETSEKLGFRTLVVDSIDWAEKLIEQQVAAEHGTRSAGGVEFGKGYADVRSYMSAFLFSLDRIRRKGVNIVLIGHEKMVEVARPDGTTYHKMAPNVRHYNDVIEWVDECLHADIEITSTKQKNAKVSVGHEQGRVLHARESAQHFAKSRMLINDEPIVATIPVDDSPSKCFDSYRQILLSYYKETSK